MKNASSSSSSSFLGVVYFCRRVQRYCYMYALKQTMLHICMFVSWEAPPLSLHLLPSLISQCSNPPSGTEGRSGKQESTPYKHRMGDPKSSVLWSPTCFCSFSALGSGTGMEMPLSIIQSCDISGFGWLNFLLITGIFLYFFVYLIICVEYQTWILPCLVLDTFVFQSIFLLSDTVNLLKK